MLSANGVHVLPCSPGNDSPAFHILCGAPISAHSIAGLKRQGFHQDPDAQIKVVIDAPQGFALSALKALEGLSLRVVVATRNPCAEYWEDLWDLHPHVLLASVRYDGKLPDVIVRAANDERYRSTPRRATPLTCAERKILHYLARGFSNKEVASHLSICSKTVMNTLTTIYQKLNLKSREEAILYYWGIKQVLDGTIQPVEF